MEIKNVCVKRQVVDKSFTVNHLQQIIYQWWKSFCEELCADSGGGVLESSGWAPGKATRVMFGGKVAMVECCDFELGFEASDVSI